MKGNDKMERVKIKNNLELERDIHSNAIINTSMNGYENRLKQIKNQQKLVSHQDFVVNHQVQI